MLPGLSTPLDAALSFVEGDYFPGIPSITVSPAPVNDVASARFSIVSQNTVTPTRQDYSTAGGTIGIVSANGWILSMPARACTLDVGKYNYQFETTDTSGIVMTIFEGVLEIKEDFIP